MFGCPPNIELFLICEYDCHALPNLAVADCTIDTSVSMIALAPTLYYAYYECERNLGKESALDVNGYICSRHLHITLPLQEL